MTQECKYEEVAYVTEDKYTLQRPLKGLGRAGRSINENCLVFDWILLKKMIWNKNTTKESIQYNYFIKTDKELSCLVFVEVFENPFRRLTSTLRQFKDFFVLLFVSFLLIKWFYPFMDCFCFLCFLSNFCETGCF